MAVEVLRAIPDTLTPGDSYDIQLTRPAYAASSGWVLTWSISGPQRLDISSTASVADHVLTVSVEHSGTLVAGTYGWQLRATNGTTARVIESGTLTVLADLSRFEPGEHTGPGYWAELIAACDRAMLEAMTGGGMASYMVANRQVMFKSTDEIRRVRAWAEARRVRARRRSAFGSVSVNLFRGW